MTQHPEDAPIHGNADSVPAYGSSQSNQGRGLRDTEVVDPAAETPSRAARVGRESGADALQGVGGDLPDESDRRGPVEVHIDPTSADGDTMAPPSAHRADTMVRAVSGEARQQMERGDQQMNEANFTKGDNAPTVDRSRASYTVEEMDEALSAAPRGIFPDTPGGDGATRLSVERDTFLANMQERARFDSDAETVRWAQAVFNAIRNRAYEADSTLLNEVSDVVRFGEAPEVQVEEMMWGGDFVSRLQRLLAVESSWSSDRLREEVAQAANEPTNSAWIDAAIYGYLGTLKSYVGDSAPSDLGALQDVWDKA